MRFYRYISTVSKVFTQDDLNFAISEYKTGKHQWEIAQKLGCSQRAISSILRKNNIPTRIGKQILYQNVNTELFKEINSEASAYFFGLLCADGIINTYSIILQGKSTNQSIIKNFRDIISPSSPLLTVKNGVRLGIHRKEICEQIIVLGWKPQRSFELVVPDTVPKHFIRHYLRGYSDGKGNIIDNKHKYSTNTIWRITAPKMFCSQVANILKEHLNITCSQSPNKSKRGILPTARLTVGGNNQVEKVLDWLYQDATIYVANKFLLYQTFKNRKASLSYTEFIPINFTLEDEKTITKLYDDGLTAQEIAEQYDVSKPTILGILHKHNVPMRTSTLSQEEFITRFNEIHGNKNYDVSLAHYQNMQTKVQIICSKHGSFWKRPGNLLTLEQGCPECSWWSGTSKSENAWLDQIGIPKEFRQYRIRIGSKILKADGFDPVTNTIYEFYGDYWHGNPLVYNPDNINADTKKPFGQMYQETLQRENLLKSNGYNLIVKWQTQ